MSIFISSIVILFTFLSVFIFGNYSFANTSKIKKNQDLIYLNSLVKAFPIISIILIWGIRNEVGVDFLAYKETYEHLISSDLSESLHTSKMEWLFTTICCILHSLSIPYYGMFFVMTIIPMVFYGLFLKSYPNYTFSATFFLFATGVFFWYLNIMRQGIAFFILLYATKFIIDKKFIKYLFWAFIATGFHNAAILSIPLYFLTYVRGRIAPSYVLLTIFILSWLFGNALLGVLLNYMGNGLLKNTIYSNYTNVIMSWNMKVGSGLGILSLKLVDISIIISSGFLVRHLYRLRYDIYYNIFILGAIMANIAGTNMILSRVPFCLVSMRFFLCSLLCHTTYKFWKEMPLKVRFSSLTCLVFSLANLLGNILILDYKCI